MSKGLKYNCVFGGGGVRGICYVGALQALSEQNIEIDKIAGSSVGAVFAMLYAVGYSADDIKEFFMDFSFSIFRDINIKIFDGDISLSKGEIFLEWLREKIEIKYYGEKYNKGGNPPVCFKDIEKNLYILTLDINTNTQYIFSKETTPYEEIALAVRISASMPGLMKPLQKDECTLVDGDLIKTRPAFKIYDDLNNSENRILEFRLEGTRDGNSIKKPTDYLNTVISTIWYLSTEYIYELYHNNDKYDFIIMDAKEVILFDFSIDRSVREYLIEKGYKSTKYYLTDTLVKKKKKLIEIYNRILINLEYLNKEIDKNNAKGVVNVINEILSNMVEYISYIDNLIYKKLRELKSNILINTRRKLIFTDGLINKKSIKEKSEFLIFILKEKIEELEEYIKM